MPLERKGGVTISQVAEAAGVARSSVSRAYTKPHMLSPETVEHIKAVAERMGYVPNHTARALSTGRNGNIALIVPDVANPFFPPLIRAAQVEADRFDFCVFLGNSDEDPEKEDKLLGRLSSQVEGVILASPRLSDNRILAHASLKPMVLINRNVEGIPRVLIDSGIGVAEAARHLAELGHKRIVYVSGPSASWSNKQRRAAVRKSAAALGLELGILSASVPSFEAGLQAVPSILARNATAAIAFDDVMAQGILAGLAARDVAVPKDFSVVGCDDALGPLVLPPLTTVSSRSVEAGKLAVSLLMEMLQSRALTDASYVLETHLVVRGTTDGAREARHRPPAAASADQAGGRATGGT
ncbi:LacI family DNA-binding transcriptional regulator [Chelativorans sp. AA-79]|uniref:LacI family DNA-binding transcriptional regulator n=1 Tax=Chelativorans sp. AA-79 TaxID=3028735 RepID=UPI0023F6373B|nr:LacI family DNA-binding transcriptional regulator [Chelativorans sp. AA-79]WEX08765.1 LacI family DNA-binding transcriptional regulator [Chelativorans sp. AA-79]